VVRQSQEQDQINPYAFSEGAATATATADRLGINYEMRTQVKMDKDYVRVCFETDSDGLGGGSPERLWAKRMSEAELCFRLQNSPFYAKGVSYLDVVEASENPDYPGEFQYVKTLRPSGHSTYRLLVDKGSAGFIQWWEPLKQLGCTYEYSDEGAKLLYAVDVPESTDVVRVYRILQAGENESVWVFDEGHCGHSLDEQKG